MLKRLIQFAGCLVLALFVPAHAQQKPSTRVDEVRAAETAFAKSMADRNLAAFTVLLADDAIFWGGKGVNARQSRQSPRTGNDFLTVRRRRFRGRLLKLKSCRQATWDSPAVPCSIRRATASARSIPSGSAKPTARGRSSSTRAVRLVTAGGSSNKAPSNVVPTFRSAVRPRQRPHVR